MLSDHLGLTMTTPHINLVFNVNRREPELIAPAKPTPNEFKPLSDFDDQESLRFQIPVIHFYRHDPSMKGKDPVKVIREALAKTLVFYYPFAGRLREGPNRKLVVECTGEGVIFIEADADVTLEEFGDALQPPFPGFEELLFDVPGSSGILNCPLLLIQVTRLKCGGFIFALRLNHTVSDAPGLVQFLSAIGEMAYGANTPSVLPTWERHVLSAREPPCVTCIHREYEEVDDTDNAVIPLDEMVQWSFFFGAAEISSLRRHLPPGHLRACSTFEILMACLWKCRTIAMQPDPTKEMRLIVLVNARNRYNSMIPKGYYGNGFAIPAAIATAGELARNPLGYAVELIQKTKATVTEEYVRSVADFLVINGRPHYTVARTFVVSDVTRAGFMEVDFGWGKAAYGGPAIGGVGATSAGGLVSFCIPSKNREGENGIVLPICLPAPSMDRFVKELDKMLKKQHKFGGGETQSKFIASCL